MIFKLLTVLDNCECDEKWMKDGVELVCGDDFTTTEYEPDGSFVLMVKMAFAVVIMSWLSI